MKTWKTDFAAGERFKIKGHVFELGHVGKRSLILRKISVQPETEAVNQNNSETDTEKKDQ